MPAADQRVEAYAARLRETGYDVGYLVERLLPVEHVVDVRHHRVAQPLGHLAPPQELAHQVELHLPLRNGWMLRVMRRRIR